MYVEASFGTDMTKCYIRRINRLTFIALANQS